MTAGRSCACTSTDRPPSSRLIFVSGDSGCGGCAVAELSGAVGAGTPRLDGRGGAPCASTCPCRSRKTRRHSRPPHHMDFCLSHHTACFSLSKDPLISHQLPASTAYCVTVAYGRRPCQDMVICSMCRCLQGASGRSTFLATIWCATTL